MLALCYHFDGKYTDFFRQKQIFPQKSTYEYDEYGIWILQYMRAKDEMGPDELFIREIKYQE